MAARKGGARVQPRMSKPRLMIRAHFDDGTSEATPFAEVLAAHVEQLRKFGEMTGNSRSYLAFFERLTYVWLEAERALARRSRAGKAKADKAAMPADVAELFAQAYDRLAAKGAKRIGRTALAREARNKLKPGDPRRDQCQEHDARRWLEERGSK